MKVLLISPQTKEVKGGIAAWTRQYMNGCKQVNIDCDIVNTALIGKRAIKSTNKRSLVDEIQRTKKIFRDLKEKLNTNVYEVVHFNSSIGCWGIIRDYYMVKKITKRNIPVVLHFHCDIPFCVSNKIIERYLRKILQLGKAVFVLCENSKRYLKEKFDIDSIQVPNFIEEDIIVDNKIINEEIKTIFFVGRVSLNKGAKEMYELAERFPLINFELVGDIAKEVINWRRPSNLFLLGPKSHEEVLSHLDHSDLFLFPSHTEGFSMALAESMARGVPSIATDVGASVTMLENEGGIIVKIGDIQAMELAIKKMIDKATREKMSVWCIQKSRKHYVVNEVIKLFLSCYQNI